MTYRTLISRISLSVSGLLLPVLMAAPLAAQVVAPVRALITKPVDESKLVAVQSHVSPLLKGAKDLGAVDATQPAGRLMLVLKRSDEQEASLQKFLEEVHESNSPNFHKWLKPADFGARYGVADSDVAQLTTWLGQHGLTVAKVSAGKTTIEFSGSVGNVNQAFHTSIHTYNVNGVTHHANATVVQVPEALAGVIAGVTQMNDFKPVPLSKARGRVNYNPVTHSVKPQWTYSGSSGSLFYLLSPGDFSTQYDVAPAYAAGLTGTGQTIGIINDSNIDVSLVNAYRKIFGLPVNPPQVVVDGYDPGITGDSLEAYLDVENAGAVAPNATIKLYTAGAYGLFGDGGIFFAMTRAVDDDAASVLSVSFGECELAIGTEGNLAINSTWEQAAAQGQTVLVAAGDSGSYDGCYGLGVSGLASTPWNIAVGGTDIYLSDYATGGASLAGYWSSTNDAKLGSLLKVFPEQPWDNTLYGLNSTTYDPAGYQMPTTGAGGGGASSCTASTYNSVTQTYTCQGKWPKPSWQSGTGVPSDAARDIPDVSLFAADAYNGVAWPICAFDGDCTVTNPATGELLVTGVGGTSASTPAMAGIMALVNQKYGLQGQANYTLYPLAAQYPAVFKDMTIGSNNIPCYSYQVGCSLDANGQTYSLQRYAAHTGYDQASGWGSVDVNALLTNWNKITFQTSATQLTLTPTTLTHGQNITATATVTGKGTPAGSVALIASSTLPANTGQYDLVLNSQGVGQASFNNLPGGTYTIYGQYSGDGVNGASKSTSTTVTVNPEPSVETLTGEYYNANIAAVDFVAQNGSIPYDTALVLEVGIEGTVSAAAKASDGAATGAVVFKDGSTVLATVPLSSAGIAEYVAYGMAVGAHSITVSYAGDPSYQASVSSALNFTVTQQQSVTQLQADRNIATYNADHSYGYRVGQTVTMGAIVLTKGTELAPPPTGTLTFQLGSGTPIVQPMVHENYVTFGQTSVTGSAVATFPPLTAGTQTLKITYSGDTNYAASSTSQVLEVVSSPLLPTTVQAVLVSPTDPTTITPGTYVTMKATITGSGTTAPTGKVNIFEANLQYISADNFKGNNVVPGTGNTSTATFTFLAGDLQPEQNLLVFTYGGDTTYQGSSSSAINIPDSDADFSLLLTTPNVAIPSGSSGTASLQIGSTNGYAGAVALTCTAPTGLTCTMSAGSVTLAASGSTSATVTINSSITTGSVHYGWRVGGGGVVLAGLLLVFLPRRRRLLPLVCCLLSVALIAGTVGCGGASGGSKGPVITNAKAGTYNVLVTGTSSTGAVHDAVVTVIVQ
jgi:subtilase family serine protease